MLSNKVSSKRVEKRADAFLEGLKKRPDLATGLPCSSEAITASKSKVAALATELASAKNAVHAAVLALNAAAVELRGQLNSNLAVAAMLYGTQSDAIEFLGGKIRRGGRRSAGVTAGNVPKADASPSDAISHAA